MDRFVAWAAQMWLGCQNAILAVVRFLLFPGGFPRAPRCLVVFRVGNIGDTITALPAMAAVRAHFPGSRVVFLTSPGPATLPGAKELLENSDLFDEMIRYTSEDIATWSGKRGLLKRVRAARPVGYIELSMAMTSFRVSLRNIIFARMTGARAYVAGGVTTPSFGRRAHARRYPQIHDAERTMRILSRVVPEPGPYAFPIPARPEARALAESVLAYLADPILALCPGGKREINRWPADRFGSVARRLAEGYGASVIVIGGPGDGPLYDAIREKHPGAMSAVGLDLQGTADILRRVALLLTNDTGPMHLAAAVGTPVVAVFSARDYQNKWYPYGTQHTVLRREVPCSACFLEQCPTMHCTRELTVDEVTAACETLLERMNQPTAPRSAPVPLRRT